MIHSIQLFNKFVSISAAVSVLCHTNMQNQTCPKLKDTMNQNQQRELYILMVIKLLVRIKLVDIYNLQLFTIWIFTFLLKLSNLEKSMFIMDVYFINNLYWILHFYIYQIFLIANNLYGFSMSKPLPYAKFSWLTKKVDFYLCYILHIVYVIKV